MRLLTTVKKGFRVVPPLAGRELLVDGPLGRAAPVELHDLGVVEDPVPGESVLVGGNAQAYIGESSVHGGSPSAG